MMWRIAPCALHAFLVLLTTVPAAGQHDVPLYRVYETVITNDRDYDNRFRDVTLHATFTSPSGKATTFRGFFDGDGKGGGSADSGNVWKLRFMPDEPGTWTYRYRWSDGTTGGGGRFTAVRQGAGKGVLRPYRKNPRWLAYRGTEPTYIKSYYVGAAFNHSLDWYAEHVYRPLLERGYDHVMVNNGMPVAWMGPGDVPGNVWTDYDGEVLDVLIYDRLDPYVQNLEVWHRFERHMRWLNARDVGIHLFEGLTANGKRRVWRQRTVFEELSPEKQDFWIQYVCARLAPFANLAGWKYTWEKGFDATARRMFDLLKQYDPWDHLRDIHTTSPDGAADDPRVTWSGLSAGWVTTAAESHRHALDLFQAAGADNPPFMEEVLWQTAQQDRTPEQFRRIAWGMATAGATFTWNWAAPNAGERWRSDQIFETPIDEYCDVLFDVVRAFRLGSMRPAEDLLSDRAATAFALAEPGRQYLVYTEDGGAFRLDLRPGNYAAHWTDTATGRRTNLDPFDWPGGKRRFTPPNPETDWALTIRATAEGQRRDIHHRR